MEETDLKTEFDLAMFDMGLNVKKAILETNIKLKLDEVEVLGSQILNLENEVKLIDVELGLSTDTTQTDDTSGSTLIL